MKAWFVKWGVTRSGGLRILALILVLLIAAALAVLAFEYDSGYETYEPTYYSYYTHENIIHIDVCDDGNISVYPHTKNYLVEENYYGNFMVSIQLETEIDEIVFSLPDGWYYHLMGGDTDYYTHYNYPYGYYDGNYYDYLIIELVPPDFYYENILDYDYYNDIPESDYMTYMPYQESSYHEYDDYIPGGGVIGDAPDYIGIVPALGGNTVTFVPNGGAFLGGLPNVQLTTGLDGTVDSWNLLTNLFRRTGTDGGFSGGAVAQMGATTPQGVTMLITLQTGLIALQW